jgi:hypothetical protein
LLSIFIFIDELEMIGDDGQIVVFLLFFRRSGKGEFLKNEGKNRRKLLFISGLVVVSLNVD